MGRSDRVHGVRPSSRRVRRFRGRLLAWYRNNGRFFPWRSPNVSTYRLVVTEVLLQRTQAETVARAYHGFFRAFPS
jgi:A/G-specific adenine glycosylase